MILFVILKETVSMLDLQQHNIQTNQLLFLILERIYIYIYINSCEYYFLNIFLHQCSIQVIQRNII
jgi:hypothetical protein